jgi:putative membrane protein
VSGSSGLTLKRRCATRTEGSERCVLSFILVTVYPWIKSLHIVAMVAWMAGLFYLPRLFVYHSERASPGSEQSETFKIMERKLLRLIMNPAMAATWILGILLAITPGIVDWSGAGWIYVKLLVVFGLTLFHHWLALRRKDFARDTNKVSGRTYRLMNELPLAGLLVIVVMVVVRPF